MAVDISEELLVIKTDPYGSHVKDAIHDALYKLSLESGGGGQVDIMADVSFTCIPTLQSTPLSGIIGVATQEDR